MSIRLISNDGVGIELGFGGPFSLGFGVFSPKENLLSGSGYGGIAKVVAYIGPIVLVLFNLHKEMIEFGVLNCHVSFFWSHG